MIAATSRTRVMRSVLAAATLAACAGGAEENESATTPVVAVQTAVVTEEPFTETVGAIGTVVARPGHIASLGAPTATRVSQVYVSEGTRVSRGQALVALDRSSIDAAAQAAETALTAAQQAFERAERLNREGVSPRKDVEQATADLASARANAVTARRAAQLAVLRAPIAGVVTRLAAVLGASVDVNQPLVEVADPSALDIVFTITPTDAGRVRPKASVELSAGQKTGGEALGTGTVTFVAASVDSVTRGVPVRVRAPNARRALRIGETLFGRIVVGMRAKALAVPLAALVPDGEGFKVFVVDSASVAHAQPVTVGARSDSTAEILTGLTAAQRVVTYGAYGVDDGVKVATGATPARPATDSAAKP